MLRTLTLTSYRSYPKHSFTFSPNTTVILGPNTAGKTNLLESIFLLSSGESFRAQRESEMVAEGSEIARVKGKIANGELHQSKPDHPLDEMTNDKGQTTNETEELETVITTGEVAGQKTPIKRYFVNGVARRQIDFVGKLPAVLFWPEDLDIVTHSPSYRRKYLDFVLAQTDREYRRSLYSYEKGLRQRNRILEKIREGEAERSQLLFWDQLLIKSGSYITAKRSSYIESINASDKPFGNFRIFYDQSEISVIRLAQYKAEEVAAGVTLVGPHRDDLIFYEGKRDLARFGSRGEQRLLVLWLKMAELDFVEVAIGERPLLLLDDIFSELDHKHREEVVKIARSQQTIITTTDIHFLPTDFVKNVEMVELKR